MLTISYIITVFNKSQYLANVLNSLKAVSGNFKKEYVFINDGSNDNSLEIIEKITKNWQNVIIIDQKNQGPSISTNTAITKCSGDYVHFVDGDDIIDENSTSLLLKALMSFDCDVAFSAKGSYDTNTLNKHYVEESSNLLFINNPIKELLKGKISCIRKIGSTGSLVKRKLLKQVEGCDEKVFIQDFSLSLRCAKVSKFVKVNRSLYYCPQEYNNQHISANKNFELYQSLLAIFNFIRENPDVCKRYSNAIFKALWSISWKIKKNPLSFLGYLKSRLDFSNKSWDDLIIAYESHLETFSYANQR